MKRVILVITLLLSSVCHAQTDTVFWFAAPDLSINHQQTPIRFCFTTYSQPATITVSQPANNSYTPFAITLPADSFYVYDVSAWVDSIETKPVNTVLNRGFLITSTAPISCYYESVGNNSEIYTLKGNNALGTDFVVPMQFIHPSNYGSHSPSSIEIIASEDGTLIQITAPVAIHGGLAANTTFTILLNRGQSYAIRSNGYAATDHLGGTIIHSNKPISVNSTDDSMDSEEGCIDLLGDQMVPTRLLGQRYVALRNDSQFEYVFIYPLNTDSIEVYLNGVGGLYTGVPAVPYMSFPLTDTATLITLDRPAAVFQMTAIGCEVGGTMLPYLDCTGSNKVSHLRPEGSNMIVTIVVKNDHISHFLLNGDSTILTASDFTPLAADTTYAWCIKDMSPYVPSGSLMTLYNPRGRFQLGILDGSPSGDCSYGYFSDYAKVSYIRLNMDTLYCIGDSIVFDYAAPYVTDLVLTGPNGLRLTSTPFILHNVDTTMTGMYRLEGVDTAGCEELISDSIFIHIQNSSVRLIMDSLFCSGDDISFDFLLDNAANPILQGPNGVEFGSPPFILFDADSTMSGLYRITADDLTGCHYAPADSIRIQILYRYEANIYDTIVENQLPWRRFNTYFYDETDTIIRHGSLSSECDSIFNFHLQVYHHIEDTVLYYTCESDLPVQYDDSLFYQEGLGHFHYTGSHGEDSIVTFILHIIPSSDTTICDSITEDQLPWFALDTVFNDTVADYIYHLFNEAGCDSTIHYSLYIFWNGDHCDTALTYPNVVTPNGDGVNDRFVIGGLIEHNCFKYSELTIYDRYGHCVYHKRNIANESDWWNPAAQRAPSGTYFYYFKAHGVNIWTQHRGVIEVLRDK